MVNDNLTGFLLQGLSTLHNVPFPKKLFVLIHFEPRFVNQIKKAVLGCILFYVAILYEIDIFYMK